MAAPRFSVELRDGWLVERVDPAGTPFRVVTNVDAGRFSRLWMDVVPEAHGS